MLYRFLWKKMADYEQNPVILKALEKNGMPYIYSHAA
jgi:hypothetical protein